MAGLTGFHAAFGEGDPHGASAEALAAKWRGVLPDLVVEEWERTGLRVFRQGLFRWVDPDDLAPVLLDWFGPRHRYLAFARSAWGDLWLWDRSTLYLLMVHRGLLVTMGEHLDQYFDSLAADYSRTDLLREPLFIEATQRLGPIGDDEMFTFEPALALGGPETIDAVARVKLAEQSSILAQLNSPVSVLPLLKL